MHIHFYKYQGAGNDFIILDNRDEKYNSLLTDQVYFLCGRRFGIGADGLILLNTSFEKNSFGTMKYYNADGREGSMCGNGGRCLAAFARTLGLWKNKSSFNAVDGKHEVAEMENEWIQLKMQDVNVVELNHDNAILNTGSPHYVKYVDRIENIDVVQEGKKIRNSPQFIKEGINVNFIEYGTDGLLIRTYERGVEDETLACGTGVTAAALVAAGNKNQQYEIPVKARGGDLQVRFEKIDGQHFKNIWLCGPAEFVFEGEINL